MKYSSPFLNKDRLESYKFFMKKIYICFKTGKIYRNEIKKYFLYKMLAIFSFIEQSPLIYQIHTHEETCKKSIEELVKKYIIQKRNFESQDPLTIQLNEIKPESFSQYPNFTYFKIDDKTFDIYQHEMIDKIEKGWVWNGTSKIVSSKKIGYFQIQNILEPHLVEPEIFPEEITEEQLQMYQDIENMIDEILSSIEKGNEDLEFEKQQIRNLPVIQTDSPSPLPSPTPKHSPIFKRNISEPVPVPNVTVPNVTVSNVTVSNVPVPKVNSVSVNQSPIKTVYNVSHDPLQENIKTNLVEIESRLLPFMDECPTITPEEEPIDLCDITPDFPRCHWSQRGKGGRRSSVRRRGAYIPSHGYSFGKLHLY